MSVKNIAVHRALVVAPFFSADSSADRAHTVASALSRSMPVDLVTGDFEHLRKCKRLIGPCAPFENVTVLSTFSYQSNVSVKRLLSHLLFAVSAAACFWRKRREYDVVYATLPLNLTAWLILNLAGARKKIVDIVDIWPDVLPFSPPVKSALQPFFSIWKWLFKASVGKADLVMAVSDSFLSEARRFAGKDARVQRFYIGQERLKSSSPKQATFTLAFVGNLGHLYDFETLLEVLAEDDVRKSVQLFVIGDGDRKDWLLAELKKRGIQHKYWGVVYDPSLLADILRSCHTGFNGYIRTTASFSYKACTYLAAGLPLLNSMTGDLNTLVRENNLGENYTGGNGRELRDALLRFRNGEWASKARSCEEFFSSTLQRDQVLIQMEKFLLGLSDHELPSIEHPAYVREPLARS